MLRYRNIILLRSQTPVVFDTEEEIAGGKGLLLTLLCKRGCMEELYCLFSYYFTCAPSVTLCD